MGMPIRRWELVVDGQTVLYKTRRTSTEEFFAKVDAGV